MKIEGVVTAMISEYPFNVGNPVNHGVFDVIYSGVYIYTPGYIAYLQIFCIYCCVVFVIKTLFSLLLTFIH